MSAGGIIAGALGLALLENVLSHPQAWGRVSSAASGIQGAERRFLSPYVPAFGAANPTTPTPGASSQPTPTPKPGIHPVSLTAPQGVTLA